MRCCFDNVLLCGAVWWCCGDMWCCTVMLWCCEVDCLTVLCQITLCFLPPTPSCPFPYHDPLPPSLAPSFPWAPSFSSSPFILSLASLPCPFLYYLAPSFTSWHLPPPLASSFPYGSFLPSLPHPLSFNSFIRPFLPFLGPFFPLSYHSWPLSFLHGPFILFWPLPSLLFPS